jgi:hypothetical protein
MQLIDFTGEVIEWRGPAPFYFSAVPEELCGKIREAARVLSYGWGVVPVTATCDGVEFKTSLFPRQGGYLVPLKDSVRAASGTEVGDQVQIELRLSL